MIKIDKKIVAWKVIKKQERNKERDDACPECGETMVKDGGCYTCINGCGFSKCDI